MSKQRVMLYKRKRRWRRVCLLGFSALIILSLLLLRIWILSDAVGLAYEINSLIAEKESLEAENKKIMVEIARLKSPERISKIAVTDLKMVRPSNTKVIFLER